MNIKRFIAREWLILLAFAASGYFVAALWQYIIKPIAKPDRPKEPSPILIAKFTEQEFNVLNNVYRNPLYVDSLLSLDTSTDTVSNILRREAFIELMNRFKRRMVNESTINPFKICIEGITDSLIMTMLEEYPSYNDYVAGLKTKSENEKRFRRLEKRIRTIDYYTLLKEEDYYLPSTLILYLLYAIVRLFLFSVRWSVKQMKKSSP